ncbi:Uncharacterised protein [Chlamydia trachomatis]|nr:Uncharacterised protein [Chlamydia trachomatis]
MQPQQRFLHFLDTLLLPSLGVQQQAFPRHCTPLLQCFLMPTFPSRETLLGMSLLIKIVSPLLDSTTPY